MQILSLVSRKKIFFQLTFESAKTYFWVTRAVRQRIPCQR